MSFVFQPNHSVPNQSYVVVKVPNQTLLFDEDVTLQCSVLNTQIPCTQIERKQNYGEPQYVDSLEIKGFTQRKGLLLKEDQSVEILVKGLRNVEVARPRFSDLFFELYVVSENGFVLAQDQLQDDKLADFE